MTMSKDSSDHTNICPQNLSSTVCYGCIRGRTGSALKRLAGLCLKGVSSFISRHYLISLVRRFPDLTLLYAQRTQQQQQQHRQQHQQQQ